MGDCESAFESHDKGQFSDPELVRKVETSDMDTLTKAKKLELLGEYKLAEKMYKRSIKENGPSAEAYTGLGNASVYISKYNGALEYYHKAVKIDPRYKYAYNGMANTYDIIQIDDSAIQAYQKAIRLDPDFYFPHNGLGNFYLKRGRHSEALPYFRQALRLNKDSALIHTNLACCLINLKQYDQAFDQFSIAKKSLENDQQLSIPNKRYMHLMLKQFKEELSKADPKEKAKFLESVGQISTSQIRIRKQ